MNKILLPFFVLLFVSCNNEQSSPSDNENTQIENELNEELQAIIGNYTFIETEYFQDETILNDTVLISIEYPEQTESWERSSSSKGPNNGNEIQIMNYENKGEKWTIYGEVKDNLIFIRGKSNTQEYMTGTIDFSNDIIKSELLIEDRAMFKFSTDASSDGMLTKYDSPLYSQPTSQGISVARIGELKEKS